MSTKMQMKLVLSDGQEFCGIGSGASDIVVGEVIFNTSMVGYQEIISDPSYVGQIVVMTYPLIGQYGIIDDDYESKTTGPAGLVVRENCDTPSNFRCTKTLTEYLQERDIPCLEAVDTRMITRIIRKKSPIYGAIVPQEMPVDEALEIIRKNPCDEKIVEKISCSKRWFARTPQHRKDVVIIDCGLKRSIVGELTRRGCNVTIVPFNTTAQEILDFDPDGVLISSGPGDPMWVSCIMDTINLLKGKVTICGIGLGHQLIGLAYGAKVKRVGCGHHGGHPIKELATGRIFTAELNHCHALDVDSLKSTDLTLTHIDASDGAVEGVESVKDKVFSCEFTPEGCPGPQESEFFDKFLKMMED